MEVWGKQKRSHADSTKAVQWGYGHAWTWTASDEDGWWVSNPKCTGADIYAATSPAQSRLGPACG
jgi:hypothetical protein